MVRILMVRILLEMGFVVFCLGAGSAPANAAPLQLLNSGVRLVVRGDTTITGRTFLSLDETYERRSSGKAQENRATGEKESGSSPSAVMDTPSGEDMHPPQQESHPFPYNLLLILIGVSLPVLLYRHNRTGAGSHGANTAQASPDEGFSAGAPLHPPLSPERDSRGIQALAGDSAASDPDGVQGERSLPEEDTPGLTIGEIRRKSQQEGKVDVTQLICFLGSTRSPYALSRSLYLLGKYRIMEALPMILREMAHPEPWVRMAAAAALVRMKRSLIEEKMIDMAEDDNPQVRAAALLVLSRVGTERSHEILRKSIWDFEPEVRETATLAIGRRRVPGAGFDIRNAMGDLEDSVRERAVWAYKRIAPIAHQGKG